MMRRLAIILLLGLAGCASAPKPPAVSAIARFFLESDDARSATFALPQSGVRVAVGPKPVLSEFDLRDVAVAQVDLGRCLVFQLTPSAARDFYRLTGSNQGRRLVLLVDGAVVGARRIDGPLTDGVLFIFVELPDADLPAVAARLKQSCVALQSALAKQK